MSDTMDRQLLQDAFAAQQRGAWAEAEQLWRAVRAQAPVRADGHLGLGAALRAQGRYSGAAGVCAVPGAALRAQGRYAEAAEVLGRATALFPDNAAIHTEHAWSVSLQGEPRAVVALWQDVQARFPARPGIMSGLSQAYRRAGQFDAAETLLADGLAQFPGHPGLITEYAGVAEQRGAVADAVQRWRDALARLPASREAVLGLGRALASAGRFDEADAVLQDALARFPADAQVLCGHALVAERRGDTAEAIRRWTRARTQLPRHRDPIIHLGQNLRRAGRFDEAEAVLAAAPDSVAGSWDLLVEWASVAQYRGDQAEAIRRWEQARQAFPDRPAVHLWLGTALWMANRPEEAEQVVAPAVARFAQRADLLALHARLAHSRHELDEALLRWRRVAALVPDSDEAAQYIGELLIDLGRTAEAEAWLADAVARFPGSVGVAERHALIPYQQSNWAEVLVRWQRIAAHHPNHPVVLSGLAEMHMELHQHDAAAVVLADLLRIDPGHVRGMTLQGSLETIRGDWQGAVRRLTAARRLAPKDTHVLAALTVARMAGMGEVPDAGAAPPEEEAATARAAAEGEQPWQALMLGFESLGDNCEFGLVQRHFGAEPIGLLRWAAIWVWELLDGLTDGFERLGDVDDFVLDVSTQYYASRSVAYRMPISTYLPLGSADPVALIPKIRRRLLFLRRKLLEDLASGEKIFVYKSMDDLSDADALALHGALQRYGRNRFLGVRRADADNPPGTVRCLAPGLAIGHIARFGNEGGGWDIDWDNWLAVCRAAAEVLVAGVSDGVADG